jgi:hypothetical protein
VAFDGLTGQYEPSVSSTDLDVFVRAVAAPRPRSVAQSTLVAGSTTSVTVTGTGFAPNAQFAMNTSANNAAGVTISNVHVTSPTTLTATIALDPTTPTGAADLEVITPGPGPGIVPSSAGDCRCATITP